MDRSSLRSVSNRWGKDFILARLAGGTLCHPDSLVFRSLCPQGHSHGRSGEPGKSQRYGTNVPGGDQSCWQNHVRRNCCTASPRENVTHNGHRNHAPGLCHWLSCGLSIPRFVPSHELLSAGYIGTVRRTAAHTLAPATATERSRHGRHFV